MPGLITERNFPTSWTIKRFKYCAQICNGGEYSDIEVEEGGYPVIGSGGEFARASKFSYCGKSVLLGRKGTVDKPLFVDGAFWCVDTMFYTKIKDFVYEKYLYYCALCFPFDYYVTSTALPSMTQRDLGSQEIAVPPKKEQKAIADFIDKECAQIDSIAADLEKQIALLQQYKKSLITETVTKGLDKSAPMKDSGNSIIGSINCCYTTKKLKYIVETPITDGPHETPALVDDGIPFLSAESVKNGILDFEYKRGYISESDHKFFCKKIKPQKNDVFIVKSGATTGNVGIVTVDQEFSIWSPLALIRCDDKTVLQKFIYYCVSSNYFKHEIEQAWSYGTQQNIGMGVIENLTVVIPPIDEQKKIVHYLDDVLASMDEMIIDKTKQLEIIQQHKKSLIYEYVTGKKRVKEVQ